MRGLVDGDGAVAWVCMVEAQEASIVSCGTIGISGFELGLISEFCTPRVHHH
jgi:hypothetical protein